MISVTLTFAKSDQHIASSRLMGLFLAGLIFCGLGTAANAATQYETLTFIANNGTEYVNYSTTRSDAPSYTVHLDKKTSLEDYLYINPNDYAFDNTQADNNRLTFDQGDYALMSEGDFTAGEIKLVEIDDEGIYTLSSWNGKTLANDHFGYWNTPDNFANFAAAWVFPNHFEVLDFISNKPGKWIQRNNTLTFLAADQNDLTFKIRYSPRTQPIYAALKAQLKDVEEVAIQQSTESVTLTFDNQILFESGAANVNLQGREVIQTLATQLKNAQENAEEALDFDVIVAGHTDNVPIKGALASRYATNWELSAHRSLNVIHALIKAGIAPTSLQSQAFGENQPRVANDSADNRRANRRTEIKIMPK